MGTTRRYRATDKTKTAKPKKKVSRREALIKRVEKLTGGKVKHARDPLRFTAKEVKAIYELGRASGAKDLSTKQKKKKSPARPTPREGQEEALQSLEKRRKWIKRQREEMRRDKRTKRKG